MGGLQRSTQHSKLKMKHKLEVSSLAATIITLGSLAGGANAAVTLTVNPLSTGGVQIVASGSLDASNFTWAEDVNQTSAPQWSFFGGFAAGSQGVSERFANSAVGYSAPSGALGGDQFYESVDLGSFGNGLLLTSFGFSVYGSAVTDDGLPPASNIFNFDFKIIDSDGDFAVYGDTTFWGGGGTGETVSFSSDPTVVPEPSSVLLLGLTSLGLLTRRRNNSSNKAVDSTC